MATDVQTEIEAFHRFLGEQLKQGATNLTPESSVALFRAYQIEVDRLREFVQAGIEQAVRGESGPLDVEAVKRRIRDRLTQQGIHG